MEIDGVRYVTDQFGIVHQDPPNVSQKYDREYVEVRYDAIPERVEHMSYLRAGWLIGAIGNPLPKTLLDVGYGNGSFLRAMQGFGVTCCGLDVSGYPIPDGCELIDWTDAGSREFGIVTFFDSLEHIANLSFMRALRARFVVVTAPYYHESANGWFASWKHRRPGEHLHHFSPMALTGWMRHQNFRFVASTSIEDAIRGKLPDGRANTFTAIYAREIER